VVINRGRPGRREPAAVMLQCFPRLRREHESRWVDPRSGTAILFLTMEPVACSSTEIRRRIASGLDISGLVPDAVRDYIIRHRLYSKPPSDRCSDDTE